MNSEWIDELLKKIDARGGPSPISDQEYLRRLRIQIEALCGHILDASPSLEAYAYKAVKEGKTEKDLALTFDSLRRAANSRWPGIIQQLDALVRKEIELSKKVSEA